VTNETYLYVSYFAAVSLGLVLTFVILAILRGPHREATAIGTAKKVGSFMRRVFPLWLIVAVLLAFISVSYIDCSHKDYQQVVADRGHLVSKTQEQVWTMLAWLAVALFTYCLMLVLFLWAAARTRRNKGGETAGR
jgi:hypothetical protein